MNILICDDMPEDADELLRLLHNSGISINTTVFHNSIDTLDYMQKGAVVDVCFLDIIMPGMPGTELAKELRAYGYAGEIIFLSASREYAPESYEVKAFSYLLKPPDGERVNAVLNELLAARRKRDTGSILLKLSHVAKSVLYQDISYVEALRHEVYFHLTDGSEIAVYATFSDITDKLLHDTRFARCHRSYIVNMDDISEIYKDGIIMRGGTAITISRTYNDIRSKYFKREFGRE